MFQSVPWKFLFIKGTLFFAGNNLLFFGNPGSKVAGADWVRTLDPQIPSLMPLQSATVLNSWLLDIPVTSFE